MKKTYYRYASEETPMSDWGHAMFVDNSTDSENYGDYRYSYDGTKGAEITEIVDKIKNAWNACKEDDFFPELNDSYYEGLGADEIVKLLNPEDIVMSAEAYDCSIVNWFYSNVLEPNDIKAVITNNGAVVFDESLIKRDGYKNEL